MILKNRFNQLWVLIVLFFLAKKTNQMTLANFVIPHNQWVEAFLAEHHLFFDVVNHVLVNFLLNVSALIRGFPRSLPSN